MSILNLGLQCVGLMREKKTEDNETLIASSKNVSQLHKLAANIPNIVPALVDSVAPVEILLSTIFQRLQLHGRNFVMFTAATEERLRALWSELESIDPSLKYEGVYQKACLKDLAGLDAFLQHCCHPRHYSFSIKNCGEPSCCICKPVRMPVETFNNLHPLPDPVPGTDGHYLAFEKIYGTQTTEQHRPSLKA